jgi:hypothetical protein
MPPREIIERLLCIGDPEHVAQNEHRLYEALLTFCQQDPSRRGSTWTPEDSIAWRAWKAAYGLKSTIVFDHLGMGSCAVCGEPLVKAKFYDGVEGYRRRVTMLPEDHVAPQPGQWVFEPEKLTRLYIVRVTNEGMVEMSYRPGNPIAVAADREDFIAHFEIIGLDAPTELPAPPTKEPK